MINYYNSKFVVKSVISWANNVLNLYTVTSCHMRTRDFSTNYDQ